MVGAVLMQAAVWEVLLYAYQLHPLWYGFFDVSDISIFNEFAGLFARGLKPYGQNPADLPGVMVGMVLILVCTSKVLSPQFLLWALPFIGLVAASRRPWQRAVGLALLGVLFVTQLGFPSRYWALVQLERTPILVLVARNVLLLAVTVLAVVQPWRMGRKQLVSATPPAPSGVLAEAESR